ncbi:bacteriohemerythrin [Terasakiella pusilla]|uniref:bacteriohemerythrin n=1 Tax=Terasakiella pusilla TaxID=64973 RepID=UPI0004912F44|nr:bacteriohemerythrin [Terasakiella pusilla]
MSDFKWTTALSVGDNEIDHDHQELFALVDELADADLSDSFLLGLIARLEKYTEYHFAREEEYMKQHAFPDLEDHLEKHHLFVEWLKTVEKTYRRSAESPFQIGDLVNDYLGNWLTEHILVEDMKYRNFILEKIRQDKAT